MTSYRFRTATFIILAFIGIFGLNSVGKAQTRGDAAHFTASYVDINTGRTGPVEISVTRWTTKDERARLQQALFKDGQDQLLDKLRDTRSVGRIYTPGSIGYDLRFAEERTLPDGGREIILATDRPMSFWEITNRPRSAEYPFTWVQFRLRADGTGDGTLAVAARITGEEADDLIEVEDFALQPVRLQNIRTKNSN